MSKPERAAGPFAGGPAPKTEIEDDEDIKAAVPKGIQKEPLVVAAREKTGILSKGSRVYLCLDFHGLALFDDKLQVTSTYLYHELVSFSADADSFKIKYIGKKAKVKSRTFLMPYAAARDCKDIMWQMVQLYLQQPQLMKKLATQGLDAINQGPKHPTQDQVAAADERLPQDQSSMPPSPTRPEVASCYEVLEDEEEEIGGRAVAQGAHKMRDRGPSEAKTHSASDKVTHAKISEIERHLRDLQGQLLLEREKQADTKQQVAIISREKEALAKENEVLVRQVEMLTNSVSSEQGGTAEMRDQNAALKELLATREEHLTAQAKEMTDLHSCEQRKKKELKLWVKEKLGIAQQELAGIRHDLMNDVKAEAEALLTAVPLMAAAAATQFEEYVAAGKFVMMDDLLKRYKKECRMRKDLYNQLMELKGNIRVFCRMRPLSPNELAAAEKDGKSAEEAYVVRVPEDHPDEITLIGRLAVRQYEYDRVFTSTSTQEQVFEAVEPLVLSVLDGFHMCIFAYGQTGSGKTYTMTGTAHDPGVNLRSLRALFRIADERREYCKVEITASALEIYNESISDLLCPEGMENEKRDVRIGPEGTIAVPGLTAREVESSSDVEAILQEATLRRATSATNMNEHSSRSHYLLSVNVQTTNNLTGAVYLGKLHLVDLAGSERISKTGAEGSRLKEAQAINKSLSALGDVISSLASKDKHIPYRNSKLTYLLQDSLGGNSKCLMFCQVSPSEEQLEETQCSLEFASRVRSVELGQAATSQKGVPAKKTSRPSAAPGSPSKPGSPGAARRPSSAAIPRR